MKRLIRSALLWLPVAAIGTSLGLGLALATTLWLWSGSAGSFEQALRWAQAASERYPGTLGELQVELDAAASHRLTDGGPVRQLRWSKDGLSVQADQLELRWPGLLAALLSGQGVVIERLAAGRLHIEDRRPPQPDSPPLTELPLPLPVDLPFEVTALQIEGAVRISASDLRGRYRYQDERHALALDGLRWADGHYRGMAALEARAPMQLDLQIDGDIRIPPQAGLAPRPLSARARVQGTLAAPDAALAVSADAPHLQLSATVRPWHPMPLERADIRMERFNVAHFWPAGPLTQLTGQITAQPLSGQDGALWQATAMLTNGQPGPWDRQRLPVRRLHARVEQLKASVEGQPWRLSQLEAYVADGPLTGQGDVTLPAAGGPPLRWDGQIRWRGWRPDALLSHLPPQAADLDAHAHQLAGETRVDLSARAAQAQLDAQGRIDVQARGFDGQATLTVPGARGVLKGRLAARDGSGQLEVDLTQAERVLAWARSLLPRGTLPALDTLRAQGAVSAKTRWRGGWQDPAALELDAQARAAGLTLGNESGSLTLDTALQVNQRQGQISVTADHLRAQSQVAAAPSTWSRWQLHSEGVLRGHWGADGLSLDASRWTLRPPVGQEPLQVQLEPLHWRTQGADAGLSTRGQLLGIPLAWLDTLPQQPLREAGLSTDLVFDASWDIAWPQQATQAPRARLRTQRRGGDIRWLSDANETPLTAGMRQLAVELDVNGDQMKVQAQWDSERAGRAEARVESRLVRRDGLPAWDKDAPLSGSITARLPQMGVWSVLAPPGWRVAGTLAAEAQVGGTRGAPQFNGSLSATELSVRSVVDGIAFTNGRLMARLQGERIAIETLELEGSGGAAVGGKLSATGSAEWVEVSGQREPRLALQVKAEQLRASTRADRRLTVSGQLDATLAGTRLTLTGDARVDQALFLLPDETTPTLGDDVVVRGRAGPAATRATRVVPNVNVNLDLGRRFEVRGHGLEARLTGRLNVRSSPERSAPQVLGEVRTASGGYQAYGQRLDIEEGVLRFTGPYDNPSLDVLAIRPYTTQRVGVQVRGTARAPQVRLYSDPDLPDSEKLAWLVLGRPATGGGAEAAVLQQAAMALLSSGGGPTLGQRLGLDELSVRGASTATTGTATESGAALTLGKRLSSRLYVSYERSLAGALGTFAMFYDISRRLTLRARAGEDNAVDLIFTVSYD